MTHMIAAPNRPQPSTGSPEALVRELTDLQLESSELVAELTRGVHWSPEPERFARAAAAELASRRELGVAFGWVRR